ncbi:MAG: hypothetical protein QW667_03620 [Candidatus Bathyarchaeia archaeon]
MRKTIFFGGIIFLLVGLAFLLVSSYLQNFNLVLVEKVSNSLGMSAILEEKKTYVLDIISSEAWRDDYTAGWYEEAQPVEIVITSPNGNRTRLLAYFLARLPTSSAYKSTLPTLVGVEYLSVDFHSLDVDKYYPRVRITIKQGGYYQFNIVEQTLNWTSGPPREIQLYREVVEIQESQALFLQCGSVLSIVGFATSVYGARAAKKLRTKKRVIQQ